MSGRPICKHRQPENEFLWGRRK